jgi:hypothetical protein
MEWPWTEEDPLTVRQLLTNHFVPHLTARAQRGEIRPTIVRHVQSLVEAMIVPTIGNEKVAQLDTWVINHLLIDVLSRDDVAPRFIQRSVVVLKAATAFGLYNGVSGRDPLAWVKPPTRSRDSRARYYAPDGF